MQIKTKSPLSVGEASLQVYTESLLTYTKINAEFAQYFADQIIKEDWTRADQAEKIRSSSLYTQPDSLADAEATTSWVINNLQTHPEYRHTRSALATWAQDYESPKNIVLGIVGVAIIGPTLGIISRRKKKRGAQVVIEKSFYKSLLRKELATLTNTLTQAVIAKETKLAGGNIYNLHPDSAAWCLEEAQTKIYTAAESDIGNLARLAKADKLSHFIQNNAIGKAEVIVISPSVNDSLVEESQAEEI